MSAQILADSETDYVAPAMQMWEWFDIWGAYMEWRSQTGSVLSEDEGEEHDSDKMSPEEQHDFYAKHFKEVLTHHGKMSRPERQARMKDVAAYAKEHGIPEHEAKRVRSGGHDIKSARSGFEVLHKALSSKEHGHKLANAARYGREDKHGGDQESNAAEVAATMMTRHGHHQSEENPLRSGMIHRRLEAREKHMAANPKEQIGPYHEHGLRRIADDTGATEDEVRSTAKSRQQGTHLSPIRNLAQQALAHAERGGKLGHEWVAKAGAHLLKMRQKSLEGTGRKEARAKAAVEAGAKEMTSKSGETTTALERTPAPLPGESRIGSKMAKPVKTKMLLHHPASDEAKKGGHALDSAEAHETLAKKLGIDSKSSIDVHSAASKLYKGGEDPKEIASKLKMPLANVEGAIMRRRSGPGAARGSGGSPSSPTLASVVGTERTKEHKKALHPAKALEKDLHDLYPLRDPAKEGETPEQKEKRESDYLKKLHHMYHGDPEKGVPAKPHLKTVDPRTDARYKGTGVSPTSIGAHGSPTSAHAGFSGVERGGYDFPDEPKAPAPHGVSHPGELSPTASKEEKAAHKAKLKDFTAAEKAHAKEQSKYEASKAGHSEKLKKFGDTMAERHAGVHKAMAPIIAAMSDPKHPENVRHAEHQAELRAAQAHGEKSRASGLEKEHVPPSLLAHHLKLAAANPETHAALGVASAKHAASALSNILQRVETHGRHSAKAAIVRGMAGQKERQGAETAPERRRLKRPGDPLSRARIRVPGKESGAGGDVGTPGHKPEKFMEPSKSETPASKVMDVRHQQARSAHVPGQIKRENEPAQRLARMRAAIKPKTVGATPPGPRGPSEAERAAAERHKAAAKQAEFARERNIEPGKPGGRKPLGGAIGKPLFRVRPTAPGTGSTVTRPLSGGEPPAKTSKEKFERVFGEKSSKPGVLIQKAGGGRTAPGVNVRISKKAEAPKPEEKKPAEEALFTRTSLVLSENRNLFGRLAELD